MKLVTEHTDHRGTTRSGHEWPGQLLLVAAVWQAIAVTCVLAQVEVPVSGCYQSAFTPNDPSKGAYGHDDFETLAGKTIAVEMFYTGWPENRVPDFPQQKCNDIVSKGAIPHITWEPWMTGSPYPLDAILTHTYDAYIVGYALQTKAWVKPLFLRLGHEMNGDWYPWCGPTNGGSTTNGFGDPSKADGPERFIAAYRRVRFLFDSVGVTNATWVWCVNNFPVPYEQWNFPLAYYPGDDVVDWIGLDGYNWGTTQSWSNWTSFYDTFKEAYNTFSASTKPMMIAEYASAETGGNKAQWILDAYLYTKVLFPKVKAITWFNINKETDWRVNSSTAALNAYRLAVSDSYYRGSVATSVAETEPPPSGASLEPPFPNPTNGGVRLTVRAGAQGRGELRVFNILGQCVALLASGVIGNGVIHWDGRNEQGSDAPTGVYVARLSTTEGQSVQRFLLTR